MMANLVALYEKGAITADHLVAECLHLIDPANPVLVLSALPREILIRMLKYANEYQPGRMRTNYGLPPAVEQVSAAKRWIEVNGSGSNGDIQQRRSERP